MDKTDSFQKNNKRNSYPNNRDRHRNKVAKIDKLLNENNLREIIELSSEIARKTGSATNQIRRIYSSVIKISELIKQAENEDRSSKLDTLWERELIMLEPRIVYQSARESSLSRLKSEVQSGIKNITKETDIKHKREKAKNLCHFLEGVVAYHKAEKQNKKTKQNKTLFRQTIPS